jgi:hypothetical protein
MPPLIMNRRLSGSITIVDLRGGIDLGEASLTLRQTIRDLVDACQTKIILNFSEVYSYIPWKVQELANLLAPTCR